MTIPSDVETLVEGLKYVAAILEANAEKFAVPDHIPAKVRTVLDAADALTALSSAPIDVKVDGLAAAVIDLAETHPKLDVTQRRGLKIVAQHS